MTPEERAEVEAFGKAGTSMSVVDYLRQRIIENPDQAPQANAQRAEGDEPPRVATFADLVNEAGAERAAFAQAHSARQFDDAADQQDADDEDDEAEE